MIPTAILNNGMRVLGRIRRGDRAPSASTYANASQANAACMRLAENPELLDAGVEPYVWRSYHVHYVVIPPREVRS